MLIQLVNIYSKSRIYGMVLSKIKKNMITLKKNKVITTLLLIIFAQVAFFLGSTKVMALDENDLRSATYRLTENNGNPRVTAVIGGQTIVFSDRDSGDNEGFGGANLKPNSNQFCENTQFGASGSKGITLYPSVSSEQLPGLIDVDYVTEDRGCMTFRGNLIFSGSGSTFTADGVSNSTTRPALGSECSDPTSRDCLEQNSLLARTQQLVNFLSAGVGLVVVIMFMIGGIKYIIAGENTQQVVAAKATIRNAIIALFVFAFTYSFLQWIIPGGVFG